MTAYTLEPFEADILEDLLLAQRQLRATPSDVATQRRSMRKVASIVTVAAALGATTAAVVVVDGTRPSTNRSNASPHRVVPIRAETVAAITARATAAIASVDHMVLHTRETRIRTTASGTVTEVYDTWADRGDPEHARTIYSENGHPVYDLQTDSAAPSERFVDYQARTWYEGPTIDYSHRHLLGSAPARIRQQLDTGSLSLVGHQVIDGRDTLHLARHDIAPLTGDLWIDAQTYLVVRSSNPTGTTDYEWLGRTTASRSDLVPRIPTGFTFGGAPPETPPNADGSLG